MNKRQLFTDYVGYLHKTLNKISLDEFETVLSLLEKAYVKQNKIFIVGNGGSASTASHLANDLAIGVGKNKHNGFRAISLTDCIPVITASANDYNYNDIFSLQLNNLGEKGDLLIAISGSGNSANIVKAAKAAKKIGMTSIGWLGMDGGRVKDFLDFYILVPSAEYGPIEDVHVVLVHLISEYFCNWQNAKKNGCVKIDKNIENLN